jgi:WD40 repeat protein
VTAGADGLARVWDVREACLNRYGAVLGNRPEYHLLLHDKDLSMVDVSETSRAAATTTGESSATAAIPIPEGDGLGNAPELAGPVLPPLPQPAGLVPQQGNADNVGDGQFIANDLIDVGVKLVSKLQHGASVDERLGGPGTRARRSAVSVICVARCPSGGHFATGSDDGICRVWQDDDCSAVEKIDSSDGHAMTETFAPTRSRRRKSVSAPSLHFLNHTLTTFVF